MQRYSTYTLDTQLRSNIDQLKKYENAKNHYIRELVRQDPNDPCYERNICTIKRNIRQANLFISSYRVIIRDLSTRK
jgi:hypothetical protein